MATRTTFICDRCGKEYTHDTGFGKICIETTATICNVISVTYGATQLDLCPSCVEKLRNFLYKESES